MRSSPCPMTMHMAQPGCQRSTTDGSGTVCCQPGGRSNPILLPGFGGATKIGMPAAASWRATSSARRVSGSNDTTFLLGDGSIGDEKSPDRCLYEDQIEKLISECAQVTVRAITSLGPVYARETRLLVLVAAENPVHPATGTPGLLRGAGVQLGGRPLLLTEDQPQHQQNPVCDSPQEKDHHDAEPCADSGSVLAGLQHLPRQTVAGVRCRGQGIDQPDHEQDVHDSKKPFEHDVRLLPVLGLVVLDGVGRPRRTQRVLRAALLQTENQPHPLRRLR